MVAAAVRFARGDLDALAGRFVHAARDDLDDLVARARRDPPQGREDAAATAFGPGDPLA